MWKCKVCEFNVADHLEKCWNCEATKDGAIEKMPITPKDISHLGQLRKNTAYPTFRKFADVMEWVLYGAAILCLIAGVVSGGGGVIVGLLLGGLLAVAGKVGKEATIMLADIADATINIAAKKIVLRTKVDMVNSKQLICIFGVSLLFSVGYANSGETCAKAKNFEAFKTNAKKYQEENLLLAKEIKSENKKNQSSESLKLILKKCDQNLDQATVNIKVYDNEQSELKQRFLTALSINCKRIELAKKEKSENELFSVFYGLKQIQFGSVEFLYNPFNLTVNCEK